MTKADWDRLKELYAINQDTMTLVEKRHFKILFDMTRLVDQHPEDWDYPCQCYECMSCGD